VLGGSVGRMLLISRVEVVAQWERIGGSVKRMLFISKVEVEALWD
jgi:hypothetical protein